MTNGRVLSRDALFESVWELSKDADLQTRTIDVHIRSLRYKLGDEGPPHFYGTQCRIPAGSRSLRMTASNSAGVCVPGTPVENG